MNDYKKSLEFWDSAFKNYSAYKIDSKFIQSELFNNIIQEHINENSKVLDFGCGSGWGLFEIFLTSRFKEGIGIDTASNSIHLCNECLKIFEKNANMEFIVGNEEYLANYPDYFDFIFSTNTLDVVPDEICFSIIDNLYNSLKKDCYMLICLNPSFTIEELTNTLKMEQKGQYFYKNDILRSNHKSIEEWENIFKNKFTLVMSEPFKINKDEPYSRRLYLLKK